MATAIEKRNRIRLLESHASILNLLKQTSESPAGDWSLGDAFEYGIIRAFELENLRVAYPFYVVGRAGGLDGKPGIIEQVDGVVYVEHLSVLVESKDYNNNVDIEPIAKLRFRLERRPPGTIGVIFTRKEVTDPARYLVRNSYPKNILLWQGDEIELAIEQRRLAKGLMSKFRHAV